MHRLLCQTFPNARSVVKGAVRAGGVLRTRPKRSVVEACRDPDSLTRRAFGAIDPFPDENDPAYRVVELPAPNLIAPGTIRTDAWAGRDAELDRASALYPLGRIGEPDDIASAVAYLALRDASWVTGTTLRVDGGLLAVNTGFRNAVSGGRDVG